MTKTVLLASLFCLLALGVGVAADKEKGEKIKILGKLKTDVAAIGGETTGIIVESGKTTYELYLGKSKELKAKAKKLNGQMVSVTGTLFIRKGLEKKERRIIVVATLEAAKE